jgi:hypothetical protein
VEAPVLVEVVDANTITRVYSGSVNEAEPQLEDASGGAPLIPRSLRRPDFHPLGGTTSDDVMSIPESFDIVDLGAGELGLLGYRRALPLPTSWRHVA